jgi:hypothetical protein
LQAGAESFPETLPDWACGEFRPTDDRMIAGEAAHEARRAAAHALLADPRPTTFPRR